MKDIFVTYSWDGLDYELQVSSFTNMLRKNGFEAEVDKLLIQSETALDFSKMMHKAMTDYKFVIIVLSQNYKLKAEKFEGGVGSEYSMVIKDIENNPNKYIIVSFEGLNRNIIPLALQNREAIDLAKPDGINKLFFKLKGLNRYAFDEVSQTLPDIRTQQLPNFSEFIKKAQFEIVNIDSINNKSLSRGDIYTYVCNSFNIEVKNMGTTLVNEYNVEISVPLGIGFKSPESKRSKEIAIITFPGTHRLFPGQSHITDLFELEVNYYNLEQALKTTVKVDIYSDSGVSSASFNLNDYFHVLDEHGSKSLLTSIVFDPNLKSQ